MRSWQKKALSLALAALMSASLVACGNDSGKESSSEPASTPASSTAAEESSKTEEADPFAEHMKISIAVWNIGDAITDGEDAVRDALYDKLNIEIEPYAVTWGDYVEKIMLWAATNKLPDMTAYEAGYTETFRKWRDEGVIRALPDASNYPNVAAQLNTESGRSINEVAHDDANPTFYAIPRPNIVVPEDAMLENGIMIRRDWMENVGVTKVPENIDEFIDLMKKFQNEDPDGNGKNDTIGLAGYTFAYMSFLFSGECPDAVNGFRWEFAEDGSLIPAFMTEAFRDGVKTLKKAYDAGIIDPDYIIYKGEEGRDKFANGQAGAYAHAGPSLGGTQAMEDKILKTYPDKTIDELIAFIPWFANPTTGEVRYPSITPSWSETYLSSSVDDAKAERCMALMDFLLSDEGYELVGLGIEGETYTKDADGNYQVIELTKSDGTPMALKEKYPATQLQTLANWTPFRSASSPAYSDGLKKLRNEYMADMESRGATFTNRPDTNGLILEDSADYDTAGADFEKICNDLMLSDDVDAAWQAMVDSYMAQGYDKVIEEMNKLYKESGR